MDRHLHQGTWVLIVTLTRLASTPSYLAATRDKVAGPPASHHRLDKGRSDNGRGQRLDSAVASNTGDETSEGSPSARNSHRCTRLPEPVIKLT